MSESLIKVFAISDFASRASFFVQVIAICFSIAIGRMALKSRNAIWLIALAGAGVAFFALISVAGEGAFLMVFWVPTIYFFAVTGRNDLR